MSKQHEDIFRFEDNQYLTFLVQGEMYAVPVNGIKEIIEFSYITEVPNMPESVKGVTNIRGNIVPVIDLGKRLSLKESIVTKRTSIIVTELVDEEDRIEVGIMVDSVNQVLDINHSDLESSPSLGVKIRKDFIKMMGKVNGKFIIILEISNLLNLEEISA